MLANLSLKEIGNFLNKLAEKSDSVYWLSSPDLKKITYISPAYEKIWRRSREELYQTPEVWINYLHPEDIQEGYHPIHSMAQRIHELGEKARYDETYRIFRPDGSVRWILDRGFPIYDDKGICIGVTGVAVDFTNEKESEHLKIENEVQKQSLVEHEKFAKLADQVAHDIRSPLATVLMIAKACQDIPENQRLALREAAVQIGDIANHLLNKYQNSEESSSKSEPDSPVQEAKKSILASALLLNLLTDKKYLHKGNSIKFEHDFTQTGTFASIQIEPSALKRSISNLLNNAIEALNGKEGKVAIKLDADEQHVKIVIQDTGKGMSPELAAKIMHNIAVTQGKKDGHGIGLTQVREMLQRNQGTLKIESIEGMGTQMILTFPRVDAPDWMCESLTIGQQDVIVILDDDASIHKAWDAHFEELLAQEPMLTLHHFTQATEAIDYIQGLDETYRPSIFLLTDYELLKQSLNGLEVIQQLEPIRAVLVTSHYANQEVQQMASAQNIKIIPKQLASEIPIHLQRGPAEMIFVDDDPDFIQTTKNCMFYDRTIDHYLSPSAFFAAMDRYPKDIKVFLDNRFGNDTINGLEAAGKLHELGFTRLYLFSGDVFRNSEIPPYLTLIVKTDIKKLEAAGNA